jgi:hypothetical protein
VSSELGHRRGLTAARLSWAEVVLARTCPGDGIRDPFIGAPRTLDPFAADAEHTGYWVTLAFIICDAALRTIVVTPVGYVPGHAANARRARRLVASQARRLPFLPFVGCGSGRRQTKRWPRISGRNQRNSCGSRACLRSGSFSPSGLERLPAGATLGCS